MDNQAALAYLVKMEGARNLLTIQEAKEIWEFCLANQITYCRIPAEDSKYQGRPGIQGNEKFVKPQALGPVNVDLFRSWLYHQIPKYISRQPDPHAWMVDAFKKKLDTPKSIRFPIFCSYRESVSQSNEGQVYVDHNSDLCGLPNHGTPSY